ncbi:MAG: phosphonate C-P lyase system protein PhnL [Sulfuriferula sp.]
MDDIILSVESYAKQFYLHSHQRFIPSAAEVTLTVRAGQLTALTGPTGVGKSSVLKGIYRTYLPSAGRIMYHDTRGHVLDLALAGEHRILELRKYEIGFVTQFLHCLPRQAALDVVAEPLLTRGVAREAARKQSAELLERLAVPQRLWSVPPATFSGGEKQRINLARGLIARPRLLLLDEPTASLDPVTTEHVITLLQEMKRDGIGMIAIFHHPALVERLADVVVQLAPPTMINERIESMA